LELIKKLLDVLNADFMEDHPDPGSRLSGAGSYPWLKRGLQMSGVRAMLAEHVHFQKKV